LAELASRRTGRQKAPSLDVDFAKYSRVDGKIINEAISLPDG
jgi:hypothetical protein